MKLTKKKLNKLKYNKNKNKNNNKNKNKRLTIKHINTRTSKKYILKGGMPFTDSGLNTSSNTADLPSIRDLIYASSMIQIFIYFDGIKLECFFGKKQLIIGNYSTQCITVEYVDNNLCELSSFFMINSKTKCISKLNPIDNSTFKETKINKIIGKLPEDYNKQLNEKLLKLIDIINAHIGIHYCTLSDKSSLLKVPKCGNLNLYVLKQFERGYGTYNEFGYLYIPINDETLESVDLIKYSDHFLKVLVALSNQTLVNLFKMISEKIDDSEKDKKKTQYGKYFEDDTIIKYYNDNKISVSDLIKNIMNYCKFPDNLNEQNSLYQYNGKFIEEFIRNTYTILDYIYSKISKQTNIKLYKYEHDGTISVSTLVNKDSDEHRHFAMTPMKKYELKLDVNSANKFTLTIS